MQLLTDVRQRTVEFAEANAAVLLTAGGVVGTAATGVLAWRGGYKTGQKVHDQENVVVQRDLEPVEFIHTPMSITDKIKLGAVDMLPPFVIGSATIASIILGHRVSAQKAAALAALYGVSQSQLEEYKAKVAEKLTGPKKDALEAELSQDRVNRTDGYDKIVVIEGEVLCFDENTGRYFRSTMEKIRRAVNTINAEIIQDDWATASRFYEEIGLPATTWTDIVGWDREHMIDLKIDTVTSPDDRPCISIDFRIAPRENWDPKYN